MCGIVSFFGRSHGAVRVLEALHLLEYRAPDSSGLAFIDPLGEFAVSRSVGPPERLAARLAAEPLSPPVSGSLAGVMQLFAKQGLELSPDSLRDLSPENGFTIDLLFHSASFSVGIGDLGSWRADGGGYSAFPCSARMAAVLAATGMLASPNFSEDPVRHAFSLVAAQVASRERLDPHTRATLNRLFLARLPGENYAGWRQAWVEEVTQNTPGQAFAVAVRFFQENFPGLSEYLDKEEWERVGTLTARALAQVVLAHGRWAMVGAVTEANAHPFPDRSRTRLVCENGSHNASLLLSIRKEQEIWWRNNGVPADEPVHRSENTTEVVVFEWERTAHRINTGEIDADESKFLEGLAGHGVLDREEQALRLALRRLVPGNTHACAFYSRIDPGVLYVSSHRKPVAIAMRTLYRGGQPSGQELMVASDVNAALMLWPGQQVDAAEQRIREIQDALQDGKVTAEHAQVEIDRLLDPFTVDVIFLDSDNSAGEQLLARIENQVECGDVRPRVRVTTYAGAPLHLEPQKLRLNPAMVGKRGFPTYTESHIAEIPQVFEALLAAYIQESRVKLEGVWQGGQLRSPGLNLPLLQARFSPRLDSISRLLLIGEGSSWRDALAAAPLFRHLHPDWVVNVYRPVEVLNLGEAINPHHDLALEISWSGTTDSLLKVDDWLAGSNVARLAVTGRPQSDLGRRTASSAGTLDVRSGVEVSVATVKGFHAILAALYMLAVQLAQLRAGDRGDGSLAHLVDELHLVVPSHVRRLVEDQDRRARLRVVAQRCRDFNKVAVIGESPVDVEAELKIEELAQVVAHSFDFHSASLRALIERSAFVADDSQRTLFIVNATTPSALRAARPVVSYLQGLGVFCVIHATPHELVDQWQRSPVTEVFLSPQVSGHFQPLVDAPFFFDFAVALAYARGLSPAEIDRPRNLAKSVTTTGAERRVEVESRADFHNVSLDEFCTGRGSHPGWDANKKRPSRAALRATVALRAALAYLGDPPPQSLGLAGARHLIVVTDTEATENAAHMAAAAWQELLGIDVTVYRRFISELPPGQPDTAFLRIIRAGAVLSAQHSQTIALPSDMTPFQWELLGSVYLASLAVRLARQRGLDTSLWDCALAHLPLVLDGILGDDRLAASIRAVLGPFVDRGYDKMQIIGGGQDFASAVSMARSLRTRGFMAEALYTDSAWHGPLATVGGLDAAHDTLIFILATDPLFQPAALVDTQVYRTRRASVVLVVPDGNQDSLAVRGVDATALIAVPSVPRLFVPLVNAALGKVLAQNFADLWGD